MSEHPPQEFTPEQLNEITNLPDPPVFKRPMSHSRDCDYFNLQSCDCR